MASDFRDFRPRTSCVSLKKRNHGRFTGCAVETGRCPRKKENKKKMEEKMEKNVRGKARIARGHAF